MCKRTEHLHRSAHDLLHCNASLGLRQLCSYAKIVWNAQKGQGKEFMCFVAGNYGKENLAPPGIAQV